MSIIFFEAEMRRLFDIQVYFALQQDDVLIDVTKNVLQFITNPACTEIIAIHASIKYLGSKSLLHIFPKFDIQCKSCTNLCPNPFRKKQLSFK